MSGQNTLSSCGLLSGQNTLSSLGATNITVADLATPPKQGISLFNGNVANSPFPTSYGSCGITVGKSYPLCIVSCVTNSGLRLFVRSCNSAGDGWNAVTDWKEIQLNSIA